jgi:hypothetical protein
MGARPRRREPEQPAAVEHAAEPIRPEERIDPGLVLAAPSEVQQGGPEAVLAWAERHRSGAVKSDADVIEERDGRAARRALALASRDARRRGLPEPDPADYVPGGFNAAE